MAETMIYTGTLIVVKCVCGIVYAVPEILHQQAKEGGKSLHCPNGCSWYYAKSDVQKLKATIASLREGQESYREQIGELERSRAAVKGQLTKTKNRIANGVCPCCNRTFVNLGKHMKSQHPSFAGEAPPKERLE